MWENCIYEKEFEAYLKFEKFEIYAWNSSMQVIIIFVFVCSQLILCEYITYIRIQSFHYPQKVIRTFEVKWSRSVMSDSLQPQGQ